MALLSPQGFTGDVYSQEDALSHPVTTPPVLYGDTTALLGPIKQHTRSKFPSSHQHGCWVKGHTWVSEHTQQRPQPFHQALSVVKQKYICLLFDPNIVRKYTKRLKLTKTRIKLAGHPSYPTPDPRSCRTAPHRVYVTAPHGVAAHRPLGPPTQDGSYPAPRAAWLCPELPREGREEEGEERDGRARGSGSGAQPDRHSGTLLTHRQRHDSAMPHGPLGAAARGGRWEV